MKNRKKGFTLAEMLVTLGIVGIIGAIVIPRVFTGFNNRTFVPARDRAVNLVQQGMSEVFARAQSDSSNVGAVTMLTAIRMNDLGLVNPNGAVNADRPIIQNGEDPFANYAALLGLEVVENDQAEITGYSAHGHENFDHFYRIKKGNQYVITQDVARNEEALGGLGETDVITRIYIDANGADSPNRDGEDIFEYGLGNDGHLYASDTQEFQSFENP